MPHIVVVGSINMDMVIRTKRIPLPGETVLGRDLQTFPGGKGANQAVASARLGAEVTMVGKVGKDTFGSELLASLKKEGIDITHVIVEEGIASGIALITLEASGQNSIVVASGANMEIMPDEITDVWKQIRDVDCVVMQLEIPLECILAASRLAKKQGIPVILNPAPARELPSGLIENLDVIVPNETEVGLLAAVPVDSEAQIEQAAYKLLEQGVGAVVVTLGSQGALLVEGPDHIMKIPSHKVEVIDTTGAGDAFVAGLAVRLAEGATLVDATRFGNASGALAVTKLGAQPSMPFRAGVNNLLQL